MNGWELVMGMKEVFQEFMDRRNSLKMVYMASCDRDGRPNCAPVVVIDIIEPDRIYYIDFKSSHTYANILQNNQTSMSIMDDRSFLGFKLNGRSEVLKSGGEYEQVKQKLRSNISTYQVDQMIERIRGITSRAPREMKLPADFVIVKFIAQEGKNASTGTVSNPFHNMAILQMRIDELEKSGAMHRQNYQATRVSRDFIKARFRLLKKVALRDELTGLYNRRGFVLLAKHHLRIAQRSSKPAFLIVADADRLKSINDTYGHIMGNKALADIALILKKSLREADIVARIGGDEFAIMLTEGGRAGVDRAMVSLAKNIEKHQQEEANPYTLELSIGFASSEPSDPSNLDELINRADQMMYEEKRKKYHQVKV